MSIARLLSLAGTLTILASCSRQQSLEEYAAALDRASVPGPAVEQFVLSTEQLPPDHRLAVLYQEVSSRWVYAEDPQDGDAPREAESLLGSNRWKGDCEDLAVLLVALARSVGVTAHVCLGESSATQGRGHVWTEIRLCDENEFSAQFSQRLSERFGKKATVVRRQGAFWLQVAAPGSLTDYRPTHCVEDGGKLVRYHAQPGE